jgi:Carboxypeptidase regulatory-like domain
VYYVLDHYGDTLPTAKAKFVPVTQKQLLKAGLRAGIWAFHFTWANAEGRVGRSKVHYQVRIGTDPGTEGIQGTVSDAAWQPLPLATLTINRGLFPNQTTESMGKFAWGKIPIGAWSITASKAGYKSVTRKVALQPDGPATMTFALAQRT